jgi:hypothetical protein
VASVEAPLPLQPIPPKRNNAVTQTSNAYRAIKSLLISNQSILVNKQNRHGEGCSLAVPVQV